ncbi:MAG: HNH endonuclease [Candidatus Acididesulfobacter diazotrophicus]|uniref:HNH endonuclease n=1 Tax=Candidatus Acididesulfobacter diazotrophicus TaxID=2597226 RepID=A0A519BMR0_9DELT|nr:MAG: HNH endonuclease [Candidatus Acididesulfobacter diazotrophicus]
MDLNVKVLEKSNNLNLKNLNNGKNNDIKSNLNISEKDIGELSDKIVGFENLTDKIKAIKTFNDEKIRSSKIIEAEGEIKDLCNSGFIIKNDNDFLCKTYGAIDNKTIESMKSMKNITSENSITEIQGIKFHEMTKYGRDIAVKNILISQKKLNDINNKKLTDNYSINDEFKLSDFTLKNYFELKEKGIKINIQKTVPGEITIISKQNNNETNGNIINSNNNNYIAFNNNFNEIKNNIKLQLNDTAKIVKYDLKEKPSVYIWKNKSDYIENIISRTLPDSSKPLLGALNYYKNYIDGFKNIKISIENKKIMELESHFNWDKVRDYIKKRDFKDEKLNYTKNIISKKESSVQIHHINQLQDGGTDNVSNYIALQEEHHKLIDSCDIFIDKNLSQYREFNFEKNIKSNNSNFKHNITNENEIKNLLDTIGKLSTSEKILLNEIKTTVESNSSCRLTIAINKEESLKLKFTDYKTNEDLRIYLLTNLDEEEKIIAFAGLNNFIKELTTYNKII